MGLNGFGRRGVILSFVLTMVSACGGSDVMTEKGSETAGPELTGVVGGSAEGEKGSDSVPADTSDIVTDTSPADPGGMVTDAPVGETSPVASPKGSVQISINKVLDNTSLLTHTAISLEVSE